MIPNGRVGGRAVRAVSGTLALALALAVGSAHAGDVAAGRKRAIACQTCHGLDGVARQPEVPNLSGQVETYLAKSLAEFRSGKRENEIMNLVAKDLSDADIANLAAHYAAIPIEVLPPD